MAYIDDIVKECLNGKKVCSKVSKCGVKYCSELTPMYVRKCEYLSDDTVEISYGVGWYAATRTFHKCNRK